jgi:hypothetical protein
MNINKLLYNYMIKDLVSDEYIVTLSDRTILDDFVKAIITKKKEENHHIQDPHNEAKRWRTGMGGELALEKFIDKKFADLTIGNSNDYHVPDLSALGLKVGIKTVELGKYPVIFKRSEKPEIIIIKLDSDRYCILGLASVDVLNKYQDDEEILSPSLRARGSKTGFVGLHSVKRFRSYEELVKLI